MTQFNLHSLKQHCDMPKLDLTNYMQVLLFCFVTGNNDMHLKNFSLYRPSNGYQLSPAYDLINVAIANPEDKEELALSLSGKKSNLKLNDFLRSASTMGLQENVVLRLIDNMRKAIPKWTSLIHGSFLSEDMKDRYEQIIMSRINRLQE